MTSPDTDNIHRYERGAEILAYSAGKFGLDVTEDTVAEWRTILGGIYELDQCLDSAEPVDVRMTRYSSLLSSIMDEASDTPDDPDYVASLRGFVTQWQQPKKDRFFSIMDTWKDVSVEKRAAKTARALGSICLLEGRMCAGLFTVEHSPTQTASNFERWLGNLIAGGTAVDAAIDLPKDYDEGIAVVKPTRLNQAILLAMALPKLAQTLAHLDIKLGKSLLGAGAVLTDNNTSKPLIVVNS